MADKLLKKVTYEYDVSEFLQRFLKDYLHNKMTFKDAPDLELTNQLIEEVKDIARLFAINRGREVALMTLLVREDDWIRENKPDIYKEQSFVIHCAFAIIKDHKHNLDSEFGVAYAIFKHLEYDPIPKGSTAEKAVRYYIRLSKNRLKGKDSPIKYMILNDIQLTPLLGYGSYLARQNKSVWEYIKEICPVFDVLDTDLLDRKSPFEAHEIFRERFNPILEYVYENNKLNHLENRIRIFKSNEERREKKRAESEAKAKVRQRAILERHLRKAFTAHENWYYGEHPGFPACFKQFVDKHGEFTGKEFMIIAVNKQGAYKHGYLNKPTARYNALNAYVGFRLEDPYIFSTADEANKALHKFKNEGVILDGSVIRV